MTIQIPNLCDSFLETAGCCWHLKASDVPDLAEVKGVTVISVNAGGCKAFGRVVVEPVRPKGRAGDMVHVHVEVTADRVFSGKKPVPSSERGVSDISSKLHSVLSDRPLPSSSAMAGYRISLEQIAVGSALSTIIGFQGKLSNDHKALLTRGTLTVISESGDDQPAELSFHLQTKDEKAYFVITVVGPGFKEYSPDCLTATASRMTNVFNKLVLAQATPEKHMSGEEDE